MDSYILRAFFFGTLVCISGVLFSQGHTELNYVPGELLVLVKGSTDISEYCDELGDATGVTITPEKRLLNSFPLWQLSFDPANNSTSKVLLESERMKDTRIAQYNHSNIVRRGEPDDPDFDQQWNFDNDGAGSDTGDVDAIRAWDITTGGVTANGDTIVVAVIDGGFNVTHEDLQDNIFTNHLEIPGNGFDDDSNGYVDDVHGWNVYSTSGTHFNDNHGTHVAGTIGARGNNGIGVTGVNWNVKILPISGSSTIESTVLESYGYALDMRRLYNETNGQQGAYVVSTNSSFGVDYGDPLDYPLWCAFYDSLGIAGIVSAGATANIDINIDQEGDVPTACASNFLISVTNTTETDIKNGGAAYGVSTIDIGAPGTSIYSTRTNGYGNSTGTSMATPHVAGAIALMQSALCEDVLETYANNPGGLAIFLKQRMLEEGVDELSTLDGLVSSGGRLNLFKAVSSVSDSCLTVITNVTNSSCGECNGMIDIQIIGGAGPYTYEWNTGSTASGLDSLCAGAYTVTITDASNESVVKHLAVSDSLSPEVEWTVSDPSCFGLADGSIVIDTGYTYSWDDGSFENTRSGLGEGFYVVSVSDTSSCNAVEIIELIEPDDIAVTSSTSIPIPYSGNNGGIALNISGGTPPYSVVWDNSATGANLSQLSVGWYVYTITDQNGCQTSDSVLVGYPAGVATVNPDIVKIYPNPVNHILNIESAFSRVLELSIVDVQGRLVYQSADQNRSIGIDVSSFNSGIYIINLRTEESMIRQLIEVTK